MSELSLIPILRMWDSNSLIFEHTFDSASFLSDLHVSGETILVVLATKVHAFNTNGKMLWKWDLDYKGTLLRHVYKSENQVFAVGHTRREIKKENRKRVIFVPTIFQLDNGNLVKKTEHAGYGAERDTVFGFNADKSDWVAWNLVDGGTVLTKLGTDSIVSLPASCLLNHRIQLHLSGH